MKLSDETIEILKNFSTINQSILFKAGSTLSTISSLKTVLATATVEETFPRDVAIYDLNKLLAKISLYKDSTLAFEADRITLVSADGNDSTYIKYCSPSVIVTPPDKKLSIGSPDFAFDLPQAKFELQRKSAGMSSSPNFVFRGDGTKVYFVATDVKDDSADASKSVIGDTDATFEIVMKVENFKMVDGSYTVEIAKKGLAKFTHKELPLEYYVAIEAAQSKFG